MVYMQQMHLSAIDLNLLVVLDALLDTGSVKQASRRLGLSPSATSHALGRLRELLDDPLLVRAGRSLVPTERAERLRPRVRGAMEEVEAILAGEPALEPRLLRRTFRLAVTDYAELVVVRPVSDELGDQAPGIDLFCTPTGDDVVDRLRGKRSDLAIGVFFDMPDDIRRTVLLHDEFVCVLRRGHPALSKKLTLERYARLGHILIAPRGDPRGVVDVRLHRHGLRRRVARTASSFLVAPFLVASSDYVLTLPARLAQRFSESLELVKREPPLEIGGFDLQMLWHRRCDDDAMHGWLRARFQAVV